MNWIKKIFGKQTTEEVENQRSGIDRRNDVDPRNPTLQSSIRKFWARYFQDNPDKERRKIPDRRRT